MQPYTQQQFTNWIMELGRYVKDYEAAVEEQAKESQRAKERERDARWLNAEKVAAFLSEVVAPVLERAREQLQQANCFAEIIWESKSDVEHPSQPIRTFALRIDLGTRKPDNTTTLPGKPASRLYYYGGFKDQRIGHATVIEWDGRQPTTSEMLDMEALTVEKIEQHVDSFVRTVFSTKARR